MKDGGGARGAAIDPREVVWEGRPAAGVVRADVAAGALAFALTAVVLGVGLAIAWRAPPVLAAELGLAYGAVVAVVVTCARAAGASAVVSLLAAFFTPLALASVVTAQEGPALFCPASACLGLLGLVLLRLRQRRATRYLVTGDAAAVDAGDVGRYRITFRFTDLPAVAPDRFGGPIGDVDFGTLEGTLETPDGKSYRITPRPRTFHRVRDPERLLAAIAAARPATPPAARPGADPGA